MKTVVDKTSEVNRTLTITLPADVVEKALDKAYDKLKKDVEIKGFRKGKVPKAVLVKKFKEHVEGEVAEQLVQDTYFDAIEKEKIDAVVHPEIKEVSFADDGSFTYVALTSVKPEFEVEDYKGLEVEKPSVEVTDADVDERIEQLRREHALLKSAEEDHAIEKDDVVIIDFQGFYQDKPMKEVKNENYSVDVGQEHLGKEFEEKLLGLKKGESTIYEIDFPADHPNPVLAGKKVEFKVDVKDVKVRVKPELDDEFAKDIDPDSESLAAFKAALKDELRQEKELTLKGDLDDRIMDKLLELNQFEVPERLVMYEVQEMVKQTEENLRRAGLSLEAAGIKIEDLIKQNKLIAEKRVRGDFILKKIAEVEEIKVTDDDLENGYQRIADQYNMSLLEVKNYFLNREEVLPFINELLSEKVLDFLRDNANFIEEKGGKAEKQVEDKDK